MKSKFENVFQVATHRLCVGCGTCFYICPEKRIRLIDIEEDGIRPIIDPGGCGACSFCLKACPGLGITLPLQQSNNRSIGQEDKRWGRFLEIWDGLAGDPEIRFKGSSGGLCTALSLFCMDEGIAEGVLHIGADPENKWKNSTFRSTSRAEIVEIDMHRRRPAMAWSALSALPINLFLLGNHATSPA